MSKYLTLSFLSVYCMTCYGVEYVCSAYKKVNASTTYTEAQLQRYRFTTRLVEGRDGATLMRGYYSTRQKRMVWEQVNVDRIENDSQVGIKKYYHFHSQMDVQLYSNPQDGKLYSVENNGRGGVQFGRCRVENP